MLRFNIDFLTCSTTEQSDRRCGYRLLSTRNSGSNARVTQLGLRLSWKLGPLADARGSVAPSSYRTATVRSDPWRQYEKTLSIHFCRYCPRPFRRGAGPASSAVTPPPASAGNRRGSVASGANGLVVSGKQAATDAGVKIWRRAATPPIRRRYLLALSVTAVGPSALAARFRS